MEYVFVILGLLCVITGIIGSLAPVLPGLPLSWLGILLVYLSPNVPYNFWILGITFIVMLIISALDYFIPAQGTKRFGGSKYGIWGTNIGLIVGLFFAPWGILIGPFVGALLGELIFDRNNHKRAFKAAFGAFLGFLAGTFMKFMVSLSFLGVFVYVVISNWSLLIK